MKKIAPKDAYLQAILRFVVYIHTCLSQAQVAYHSYRACTCECQSYFQFSSIKEQLRRSGDRILEGAEAKVFAEVLSSLLDEAIMGTLDDYELGIKCFDTLTFGQKISVMATIGNGLLRKDVPVVDLTAVVEGAIAAVFKHLKNSIVFEIDEPESRTNWRALVVAARKEMEGEHIPPATCNDIKEGEIEVEELADRILWDADYEDDYIYMDHPPEKTQWLS